ncbi:hypothetical protein Lal_00028074 [Lupinus albus]|nr:hypothetical protein Lal_00028074 [Lupinus albus]
MEDFRAISQMYFMAPKPSLSLPSPPKLNSRTYPKRIEDKKSYYLVPPTSVPVIVREYGREQWYYFCNARGISQIFSFLKSVRVSVVKKNIGKD